jgi:hypothetical protein
MYFYGQVNYSKFYQGTPFVLFGQDGIFFSFYIIMMYFFGCRGPMVLDTKRVPGGRSVFCALWAEHRLLLCAHQKKAQEYQAMDHLEYLDMLALPQGQRGKAI